MTSDEFERAWNEDIPNEAKQNILDHIQQFVVKQVLYF